MQRLILRASGSSKIGYGHIFRVLAFGEWYADKYECLLVTSNADELIVNAARNSRIDVLQLHDNSDALTHNNAEDGELPFDMAEVLEGGEIVVTDGYRFGTKYQQQIKDKGCYLICIDDEAKWHFVADAVVNPAPSVDITIYSKESATVILSGKDYFILRKCFLAPLPDQGERRRAVYIAAGGADHLGLTKKLAAEVLENTSHTVQILYSSSFSADTVAGLKILQEDYADRMILHCNLSGPEIASVIDQCTHAIVSASTVSLEVVARGIKPLIGHYVPNQLGIYNGMLKEGIAVGLGSFIDFDASKIQVYLANDAISTVEVGSGVGNIISKING